MYLSNVYKQIKVQGQSRSHKSYKHTMKKKICSDCNNSLGKNDEIMIMYMYLFTENETGSMTIFTSANIYFLNI